MTLIHAYDTGLKDSSDAIQDGNTDKAVVLSDNAINTNKPDGFGQMQKSLML